VGAAVLALVAAPLVGTTLSSASAAEPQAVTSLDFEDDSWSPWQRSGNPALAVEEDKVLQVADRANNWDGIQLPTVTFEAGKTYVASARVRLAEGTQGASNFRFVGPKSWLGNTQTTFDATGWTTVSFTHTPTETEQGQVFLGTDGIAGAYTYLVDDVAITQLGAEGEAPTVVSSVDFQTSDWQGWGQNGNPTLTTVSLGKHLRVEGRANNYDGIKSPALEFEAGVVHTFTAKARLAAGTVGTAQLSLVVDGLYKHVGATAVGADDWTTISGTWTPDADETRAVYIGSGDLVGGTGAYTYEIDDIRVTRPAPAGGGEEPTPTVTTVAAANFDGSTLGDLQQSGSPTLAYVDEGAGKALSITGRGETWHTVQSATGILEADVEYTFSARIKLLEADAGAIGRFTLYDGSYTPVGPAALSAEDWTTVTGTYTVPAGVDASTVKFAVEAGTWGSQASPATKPGFLLDDVLVTRAAGAVDPGEPQEPAEPVTVLASGFESTIAPWAGRGGTAAHTTTDARTGTGSMLAAGRTQNWHGAQTSIAPIFAPGGTYTVSAWVKLAPGTASSTAKITVAQTPSGYVTAAEVAVTADAWVELTGTYTRAAGVTGGDIYFEVADPSASFLVDDVLFVGPPVSSGGDGWVPDLEGFVPGGAVDPTTTPVTAARAVEGATNRAALTFDDGPNGAYTTELLDYLKAKDIQATFCVIGQNVQNGGAALLQRIVAEGHVLCNHGTTYADMGSWTKAQVETDLKANLAIIRTALGDPQAKVPYFRAPNGTWGQTAEVAVALGMQPLGVVNTISDWDDSLTEATLTQNLRTAMKDGEIVLVHDGGGNRAKSIAATKTVVDERLAAGWVFTLPAGGTDGWGTVKLNADFEDNTLQGWSGRDNGRGAPTVDVVSPGHASSYAARVSDRISQGQGLQHDVAGIFEPGATYDFSAWIKFEGEPGDITLSAHVASDGSSSYPNLVQLPGMSNDWVQASGTFTMPNYTSAAEIYFETKWAGSGVAGNTSTFLVDDIVFEQRPDAVIQDLDPLYSAIDVPLGVAADSRETYRSAAELLTKHFTQVTPENSMKPENWYSGRTFTPSAETKSLMDFAVENDLRVYGHVLVWHAQTPAWFFQDDAGNKLPVNDESAQIVRQRMEDHIERVAQWMYDEYGAFGSASNPIVAWDVVNETIADSGQYSDGMRRSDWYTYLGEQYIDYSFEYAEKYFNDVFAAPGGDRIELFINDYNSELPGKQQRYYDLIERLLARDVQIDGVGHQFHVSLSLPVSSLAGALAKFSDLGLQQAVTELDVTTGTPLTESLLVEQGYYYRDAFRAFRAYEDQLYSVSVWGLYDTRSWRNSSGGPLVFDEGMQAKPAYHGIMEDGELGARLRGGNVFAGDVALKPGATSDLAWSQLPLHDVDGAAAFQARWAADHLTVYVEVDDAFDAVELQVGDETSVFSRDGSGDVDGVVTEVDGGWLAVVHVPLTGASQGGTIQFDLRAVDGSRTVGWNTPGVLGTLALVEPLSTVEVVKAASAPTIDGDVDEAWSQAATVSTGKQYSGTGGATATVRTMWRDTTLYVLADVVDPTVDTSSSAPYERDSVEIFLDAGNFKNGSYRYDDTQVRIDADNNVSVGIGDEAFQLDRVESSAVRTATGYRVEAAVSLLEYGGLGTFHGLDFQVNDATDGARTAVRTWADPTGRGYLTPQRWGVAQLVSKLTPPVEGAEPQLSLSLAHVKAGGTVTVDLAGFTPGDTVGIALGAGATATGGVGGVGAAVVAPTGTTLLGSTVVAGNGTASLTVTIPASTVAGTYRVVAAVGADVLAEGVLTVLAADATGGTGGTDGGTAAGSGTAAGGKLATTGAGLGLGLLAVLILLTGSVLLVARRRGLLAQEVGRTLRR